MIFKRIGWEDPHPPGWTESNRPYQDKNRNFWCFRYFQSATPSGTQDPFDPDNQVWQGRSSPGVPSGKLRTPSALSPSWADRTPTPEERRRRAGEQEEVPRYVSTPLCTPESQRYPNPVRVLPGLRSLWLTGTFTVVGPDPPRGTCRVGRWRTRLPLWLSLSLLWRNSF